MPLPRTPVTGNNNRFVVKCTINGQEEEVILNQEECRDFQATPGEQRQAFLEGVHASHQQSLPQQLPVEEEASVSHPPPKFASTPSARKDLHKDEGGARSSFTIPRTPREKSPVSIDNSEDQEIKENLSTPKDRKNLFKNVEDWDYTETNEQEEKEQEARIDRHHEFEHRTKTHLAAIAKKFIRAVNTLKLELSREKFVDDVSRQYGDKLLKDVDDLYTKVEEAREYCEEILEEEERLQYGNYYLRNKFEDACECERIHRKYFEQQEENKRLRQTQQSQAQPPYYGSVPFNIPNTAATPLRPTIVNSAQRPGFVQMNQPIHSTPRVQQPYPGQAFIYQQPPPTVVTQRMHLHETYTDPAMGAMGPIINNHIGSQPPTGFKVYNDQTRISNPNGPSNILEPQYRHSRFRLKDELEVIEKFDGSKPQEYLRFRVQWENLDKKMNQQGADVSPLDKYNALRKVLNGTAKQLIDTKYPNDESYRKSIDRLEAMYYKPRLHGTEVIHTLSKVDKMTDTYDSLMKGYNRLKDSWDDLEHMNLSNGELKGLLLIVANEKNLSNDTWVIWHSIQNDPQYSANYMECLNAEAFLGAIHTAMNNAQRRQSVVGRNTISDYKPKPKSTLYGSYNTSMASTQKETTKQAGTGCVFCPQATHHKYQLYCPKLKSGSMSPEEIWQIMRENGITCQMCLCLGHSTRGCEAIKNGKLKKCSIKNNQNEICGKFHCRFLHQEPKKESTQQEGSSVPKESASTDQQ